MHKEMHTHVIPRHVRAVGIVIVATHFAVSVCTVTAQIALCIMQSTSYSGAHHKCKWTICANANCLSQWRPGGPVTVQVGATCRNNMRMLFLHMQLCPCVSLALLLHHNPTYAGSVHLLLIDTTTPLALVVVITLCNLHWWHFYWHNINVHTNDYIGRRTLQLTVVVVILTLCMYHIRMYIMLNTMHFFNHVRIYLHIHVC